MEPHRWLADWSSQISPVRGAARVARGLPGGTYSGRKVRRQARQTPYAAPAGSSNPDRVPQDPDRCPPHRLLVDLRGTGPPTVPPLSPASGSSLRRPAPARRPAERRHESCVVAPTAPGGRLIDCGSAASCSGRSLRSQRQPGSAVSAGPGFAPDTASAAVSYVEYYFRLLNCTRTGGWVLSDGTCKGYGSGRYSTYVKPLVFSSGITSRVSYPYAKLLAIRAKCSHFLDGDPGYRLRRAGFTGTAWGENIGCRDGYPSVYKAILTSHLVFQSEKSTRRRALANIKNPKFTYVIGIYRYNGRVRLVTDFYRP